jgi:DNA-binding NarL/FixJ family response regulator
VRLLVEAGHDVVGQASDAESLSVLATEQRPDAVVIDIRMPPTHTDEGLVAAARLRKAFPHLGILVLSQFLEPAYALRLIEEAPEGVGYLLKERVLDGATFAEALRRVVDGETVVDPAIVERLLSRKRSRDPLESLSEREREVLALVAEGLTNHAVAVRLGVTERTVESHMTAIFGKLGLAETADQHRRVCAVLTLLEA